MSHQPFESWLLDQENLSMEDRRSLQTHMDNCEHCLQLHQRWQSVHQELRMRRMVYPTPGFTQRWKAGMTERRAREQRKQAWKVAGLLLVVALFFLISMTIYISVTTSPADLLVAAVRTVSYTTGTINLGIHFVVDWLTNTPLAINLVLWIYLTVCICLLTFIWVLVLWRTNIIGVINR